MIAQNTKSFCHLIEGAAGCAFARDRQTIAVVVDALRASATAASLLEVGATSLFMVRSVSEAFAARREMSDALLFGERGGLPPEGFDGGNSPREVAIAAGHHVIFTTTTGAQRLVDAWGAYAVCMGTTLNARAVAAFTQQYAGHDVVIIPAGLADDPTFDAQEDWVAATVIARAVMDLNRSIVLGEGAEHYWQYDARIMSEGVLSLFETAPHAEKLRRVHLDADIPYCASMDTLSVVPYGVRHVCKPDYEGIFVVNTLNHAK